MYRADTRPAGHILHAQRKVPRLRPREVIIHHLKRFDVPTLEDDIGHRARALLLPATGAARCTQPRLEEA